MNKNWLIRTKSNHILGPVSKDKILELYHNGSIKPEDEVCCGNGYWFFIREDGLVSKFLLGDEIQSFNPVSESSSVLSLNQVQKDGGDNTTLVHNLNSSEIDDNKKSDNEAKTILDSEEKSSEEIEEDLEMESIMLDEYKKKDNSDAHVLDASEEKQVKLRKQNWLKYLLVVLFLGIIFLIYFRIKILRYISGGEISFFSLIQESHAQDDSSKKKIYSTIM